MNKKTFLISIAATVLLLIVAVGGYMFMNTTETTVRLVNIRSATVRYNGFTLASTNTGDTLHFRAPKSSSIEIDFTGKKTYESSKRIVSINNQPETKTITAYYSQRELQKRAVAESSVIKAAISTYNPVIPSLYNIESIRLYRHGEWGSATLIWSGDKDTDYSDNLRVIVNKTAQGWVVVNKPDILLFKDYYQNIPLDILRKVNGG